jgi:hypothetical protein
MRARARMHTCIRTYNIIYHVRTIHILVHLLNEELAFFVSVILITRMLVQHK